MKKRAQVTTFIIIGIIILAVAGLFLFARNYGLGISPERLLASKRAGIESRIDECAKSQAERALEIIGKQGGTLTPIKSKMFNGYKVNYLCYNLPNNEACVNRVLTLKDMEDELSRFIENNLRNCININDFRSSAYSLQPGNLEVSTTIGQDNVLIIVDYPITLSKDQARITFSRHTSTVNVPLGRLYLTAIDIIDSEAQVGDFDPLPYMLFHNLARIEKQRPFPDKIYIMSIRTIPFIFQFAIEGEP